MEEVMGNKTDTMSHHNNPYHNNHPINNKIN